MTQQTVTGLDLRCACGSPDIFSLKPGREPTRTAMPLFDVPIDVGEPAVAMCRVCFMRRFGRGDA